MNTIETPRGYRLKLVLGLTCCSALAACGSSGSGSTGTGGAMSSGTGGSAHGTGGMVVAGLGGMTGSGGSSATGGSPGTGGAGPTGGSSGAMGGSGGGAAACSAVFCDGFEAGTTLGAAWTVDNAVTANMVEVVSTMAHTGTNAVHMHFATNQGATFIRSTMGFPAPMNSLWGRVWLYAMTSTASPGHDVYIEASGGTNITNTGVRALNTQNGNMTINVAPPDQGPSTNMPLPRGKWTCFEWHIATNGANGVVTLYMDGAQLAVSPSYAIPPLVFQRVGYEHYAADTGGDMWIDDYAIGTARVTCN